MPHPIHRVRRFEIVAPYTLKVWHEDVSQREIDFHPVLEGELFGPLQQLEMFNAVVLDEEAGTPVWPNGADFDPATLPDWPTHREQMIEMAQQ